MDSMFILPLSILPITTNSIRTARLIKNSQLKSIVEIFRDEQTGSGQVDVEALPSICGWPAGELHPDLVIIRQLALLPSYDVYSLRISLRQLHIQVNEHATLRLSPDKADELSRYMIMFTRPLTRIIYGDDGVEVKNYEDLIRLFRDPDVAKARERLINMAKTLSIEPMEVPDFLENYGDTFMSLSYFRHCLERLEPYFTACLESLIPIRHHFQLRQNANLMKTCDQVEEVVNAVTANITGTLEAFERRTLQMWNNITQEEFQTVRGMVERQHVTIGAALCGLTVKMNAFARAFPHAHAGGPIQRADFMMSDMIQGIEIIRDAEKRYVTNGS
ncbi:hypothetical protein [Telmatospirillum sp.]|uniref:hypothetical protein n=1 Tax=Telmatospirillum sp. TaxID=2079197 RepID=UPI00283C1E73|nr:hypothetical protein [Telmatospirillum sp.]MDR3438676.1 hypothetical protein [Telmatospirillum sp.]